MKPKLITSILLFISAYSPLSLILIVKDFDFNCWRGFKHPIVVLSLLIVSSLSIILLVLSIKLIKKGNYQVKVIEVQNRSVDLINYTIPYIVSFFGFDLAKMDDVFSLIIFLLLMLFLTIKSKSVFLNPILLLMGYNLYDIKYEFEKKEHNTIILNKFENLKKGDKLYIRSLTRFLYLAKEKEENDN
ncbi:hypothetical protein [Wenyingzhuangia sp. IMCC45574]